MINVVLDLGQGIVVLLFGGDKLPTVGRWKLLSTRAAAFGENFGGGIAGFKEKTAIWRQVFAHASQQPLLVLARQKELKGVFQHVNKAKLLLKRECARIGDHKLNRETLLRRLLPRPCDHLRRDIDAGDLIAELSHAQGHASGSTR